MPFDHVDERTLRLFELSDEERIKDLEVPRWIGYTRARAGIDFLDRLLNHRKRERMPCGVIVAHTNNGKTTLVSRYASLHPPIILPEEGRLSIPVLLVPAPASPDLRAFYRIALQQMKVPTRPAWKTSDLEVEFLQNLLKFRIGMLMIDEVHNLLAGPKTQRKKFLNMLRGISNPPFMIPVAAVGTRDALIVLNSDEQMGNRYPPFALPRWKYDEEYLTLLDSYERILPLKRVSNLSERPLASRIFALSEGLIGEIYEILRLSVEAAIRGRTEQITVKVLESINYIPPSMRRPNAEALLG